MTRLWFALCPASTSAIHYETMLDHGRIKSDDHGLINRPDSVNIINVSSTVYLNS
jgi:hypothetical protein